MMKCSGMVVLNQKMQTWAQEVASGKQLQQEHTSIRFLRLSHCAVPLLLVQLPWHASYPHKPWYMKANSK